MAVVDNRRMASKRPPVQAGIDKVPDTITLEELCRNAARVLSKAGLDHRIDLYREVEVDDPAVRMMLGRPHRVRVRIKITASSLLFESEADDEAETTTGHRQPVRFEP